MLGVDVAFYRFLPAKTGKKDCPRKRGDRIALDRIVLNKTENGGWLSDIVPVITNFWKEKVVYALVTAPQNGKGAVAGSYERLIQEAFLLAERTALAKQSVPVGRRCLLSAANVVWPAAEHGGFLL